MKPLEFAYLMEKELAANAHKGDWNKWKPTFSGALRELKHHVNKLENSKSTCEMVEYSSDIANICMKIAEMFAEETL